MALTLREYQQTCIDKLYAYWQFGKGKRPVIVAPCGAGKSAILAGFCKQTLDQWPNTRILVCVDSKELVLQDEQELKRYWPEADTGIYSAGLSRRDKEGKIIFAGIQSVYRNLLIFYPAFDLVCIDESHMVSRDAESRYAELIKNATMMNPKVAIWGCTGTPYRLDQGYIWEGKDAVFDGCAHEIPIKYLIDNNFLVPIISKGGLHNIDLSEVKIHAGEYNQSQLAHAASDPLLIKDAVDEVIKYGSDRKAWIVFCAGVEHASLVCDELKSRGINVDIVTGEMPNKQRDDVIQRFKSGKLKCLCNVSVLTKGVNVPECDLIVLLTSTKSTAKYVQMVGRGLRLSPGKKDCLLLDCGDNVLEHGCIDALNPKHTRSKGESKEDAPVKTCPECRRIMHTTVRTCPGCGYEYPEQECLPCHGTTAYSGAVLTSQITPEWVDVARVNYFRHTKEGKKDSLKIVYHSPVGKQYPVWCSLDHETSAFAVRKAREWIQAAGATQFTVSDALEEALCDNWRKPTRILVKPDGKFWRVLQADYDSKVEVQGTLGV